MELRPPSRQRPARERIVESPLPKGGLGTSRGNPYPVMYPAPGRFGPARGGHRGRRYGPEVAGGIGYDNGGKLGVTRGYRLLSMHNGWNAHVEKGIAFADTDTAQDPPHTRAGKARHTIVPSLALITSQKTGTTWTSYSISRCRMVLPGSRSPAM